MTDDATETTFTYSGSTSAAGPITDVNDILAGGYVRWFRVFAITVENDGLPATGGTAIMLSNGQPNGTPSDDTASPTPADMLEADPQPGTTHDPRDPDDPSQIMSPPAPEDLTAEQASDTNLILPTERGVLLLWNEPEDPAGVTSYVIQRKVGDGEFMTIGAIDWVGDSDFRERTSFTDSREYIDGEDLQYQVGSRGASTVEPTYTDPVTYPTTHTTHTITVGDSSGLTAIKSTDGTMVELEWTPGAASNVHWVAGALKDTAADGAVTYTGIESLWELADMNDSHSSDVSGMAAGTYVFTVVPGYYDAHSVPVTEIWGDNWITPFMAEVTLP